LKEIRGNTSPEKVVVRSGANEKEIPVRGVFVELGYVPNTAPFSRLVKLDRERRIIIDENNQTNVPGLFAAGDATNVNAHQVVIAIGEGAKAALNAYNYLLTLKA
jgi:alkyl hydroperoxide reductase subunit F